MSLRAENISLAFGGLQALDGADIEVERGSIVGLIGPNGAGKSTLVNCICGIARPDGGAVTLDGDDITRDAVHRRVRRGIARTFQTPRIDADASVRNNVALGTYVHTRSRLLGSIAGTPRRLREAEASARQVEESLAGLELESVADHPVAELPVWQVRMVEVARALAMRPRYVLLDEPAAGLDGEELDLLADAVSSLRRRGLGVVLIEHNFGFVRRLADHVVVLARGRVLASGTPAQIAVDAEVMRNYLGASS